MNISEFNDQGERMILKHEPVGSCKKVLWLSFVLAAGWFAWLIISSLGQGPVGH